MNGEVPDGVLQILNRNFVELDCYCSDRFRGLSFNQLIFITLKDANLGLG